MSCQTLMNISLLAQAESVGQRTTKLAWDLPESGWKWGLYIGLMVVAIVMVLAIYIKDTFLLHGFWKFWLTVLRLSVVAGLFVILFNPHLRSQTNSVRPSRVAVLIDDSSSMSFEEKEPSAETAANSRSRTAAIIDLLSNTPLIDELRKKHEVAIYKFGSKLEGPLHIFPSKDGRATTLEDAEADSPKPTGTDGPVNWKDLLTSSGTETRMGQSVLELTGKVSGETLSGIVILGDGGSNAGVDVKAANSVAQNTRPRIRLITVGVGSSKQQVNLRVANIQGPTDVHLGDAYELSAFVQAEGMKKGQSLQLDVDLLARPVADKDAKPTLIEQREVTILENGVPVELKFQQNPSVSGSVEFIVRVTPKEKIRELREQDNIATHEVNIIERNTSVLIVAGGPMRDYRFVRNMLNRHPAVDVDVWLQSVDPDRIGQVSQDSDDLLIEFPLNFPTRPLAAEISSESKKPKRYDVVMAFDPDWSLIPAEQLKQLHDWVDELAGGLILIAGDVYTPELAGADDSLQTVRDLYPVFLTSYLLDFADDQDSDQPWKIDFTREGNNIDFLRLAEDPVTADEIWKEFEGVYRCYPTDGPKAGTTIYAHFSDPRAINENGAPILLASQFYGAGRSFYVGSPEVWRLRSISDEYYDRFWTKLVRAAGMGRLKRGNSRALLMPERVEYGIGDTVKVRVRLLNQQFQPLVQPSVDMEVVAPNGRRFIPPVKLVADGTDKREGQYVGQFRASLEGKYTLEIGVPDSKQIEVKTINVNVPDLESQNPQQHAGLLEELARDTGGKYLTLETAVAELPALLPDRSKVFIIEDRPEPLWDKNWVLYLLVGLLSVEWLTRKLLKLA
jgi:hypothetical protein